MSSPQAQPQRVRCRQIAPADFEALAGLLARGFPRSTPGYWIRGFARMAALPEIEGVPRFGYLLENDGVAVGAILLIFAMSGGGETAHIRANLSSWYVEPEFRSHSTLLVSMATKLKHVTYLNISPAPHTLKTLEAQGFQCCNDGQFAFVAALVPGGGQVHAPAPGDPDYELLAAHQGYGCESLICEQGGTRHPFVFKPRRLAMPPVKVMELIYCRSMGDFARCAGALGRHFLRRGFLGVIGDGPLPGRIGKYFPGKEPRYFKGPHRPHLNDLAFTEKVLFG
ncbi:MAG TPA: hypothetical protein VIJ72_00185 [Rhizomicrobium sp.]